MIEARFRMEEVNSGRENISMSPGCQCHLSSLLCEEQTSLSNSSLFSVEPVCKAFMSLVKDSAEFKIFAILKIEELFLG